MSTDLVVALYRDSLDWVRPLQGGVRVFVYNKCEDDRSDVFGALRPEGVLVERLPNVGSCDHSFAHHIVERWDELADWTVFSVDGPHDHLPPGVSMADALTPGESLRVPRMWRGRDWGPDGRIAWAAMGQNPKKGGTSWKDHYESGRITPAKLSFVEWARKYVGFDPDGPDWPGYAPGGIYAVPRRAITYLPRDFYARLRDQLSHAREPEEAHYCERLWPCVWSGRARYVP